MGIQSLKRALLAFAGAGAIGSAISIRSATQYVEAVPTAQADALAQKILAYDAGKNSSTAPAAIQAAHRRLYVYRIEDGLLSSKSAFQAAFGASMKAAEADTADASVQDTSKTQTPSLSPTLGSLYALHATEVSRPFRWGWIGHTLWRTHRVSDTFNIWWHTRPSRMAIMTSALHEVADPSAREAAIADAAEDVERLSCGLYSATTGMNAALVHRWKSPSSSLHGSDNDDQSSLPPAGELQLCSLWGVHFEPSALRGPRCVPLYVFYLSEPYASDAVTTWGMRARLWMDEWYSRWFAAHVAMALPKI